MSEKLIAKAIKKYNIPREKLVILTKCYFPFNDGGTGNVYQVGDTRDFVMKKGMVCRELD